MIARAVAVILRSAAKVVGGSAWSPASLSNLLQWFDPDYNASTLDSYPVFTPKESGALAVPRGQRCWLFDGSDDRGVASVSLVSGTGDFTICAWVKSTNVTTSNTVASNAGPGYQVYIVGGKLNIWTPTVGATTGAISISANVAYHVAVTRTSGTIRLYVNGTLDVSATNGDSIASSNHQIGAAGTAEHFVGRMWDHRVYSVAKTQSQIAAIYNQHQTPGTVDNAGLLAHWPCQEESGTTGYDVSGNGNHLTLTNITQSTFHATNSDVKWSLPNAKGYTLSGAVVIPAQLTNPLDAAGGALGNAGPIALPATSEVPCWTGNGLDASVTLGGGDYFPKSGDFEYSVWAYMPASPAAYEIVVSQTDGGAWSHACNIFYESGTWKVCYGIYGAHVVSIATTANAWNYIRVRKVGTTLYASVNGGAESSATCRDTLASTDATKIGHATGGMYFQGRVAGLAITQSGVTTYPLFDQCGPGSSNTNRDFYILTSNGSATLVSGGITNGTISSVFANRCPYVKDWCVQYGGGVAGNGAFVPGRIGSANDAAGNAKTLAAGKHGNPFSRVVPNVWNAPALVNRGVDSSDKLAPADTYESITTATDDGFSRNKADGADRYFATLAALTGADLTNADEYVA